MLQEHATARALMAESSLQTLSTQLETQQAETHSSSCLLQTLFTGLAQSASSFAISPACPQGAEPCSLNRQLGLGLPDQATVQLVLAHVQAVLSSNANQQHQLSMLTQRLEHYSAESATATRILKAAHQHQPESAGLDSILSPISASAHSCQPRAPDSAELCQNGNLATLAEGAVVALKDESNKLAESQAQVEQLTQQLRQAEAQAATAEAQLQTGNEQAQMLSQQLECVQQEAQQVLRKLLSSGLLLLCMVSESQPAACDILHRLTLGPVDVVHVNRVL